ncbi:hypothetical protein AB4Z29_29465 [Paenibacillus sp. 2TAB23]|uniref:hypothetical protein n=1 Tax=Paenibacillus sp. 2TAB23 TaxID=3233004 RepID=UPI003F9556A4
MDYKIFNKISGYLEGLGTINTHFGTSYGHEYVFCELEIGVPLMQIVIEYNKTSNLKNHDDVIFLPLRDVEDWKETLFEVSAYWFFSLYRMQNFQVLVAYYDDDGQELPEIPAEFDKGSNSVSNKLIDLIDQLIDGKELKVYRLETEVEERNEFDWEQFYFVFDGKVFILEFYQWG